jgi:hypothetical protein
MENFKTLFCSSKFPQACERIASEFVEIWACALKKVCQHWALYFLLPPSTYCLKSVCWFHKFCSSNPLYGSSSIFSNIILDSVFHFLCLDCTSPRSFCCHKPICTSFLAEVTNAHKVLSIWNVATGNASWSIWHATIQWQQAWPNMICIHCIHACVFTKNI